MAKYALVVMSEPGEANPGGQGRMIHAMQAAKDFKTAGHEVQLWFHGIGVTWLGMFDARADAFTRHYGPLFDELRDNIGGSCEFCTVKRFGVGASAEKLGVKVMGGEDHHSVASLVADGYQVLTF